MRRTRHRRRFHTDRIVANRRARWYRENPYHLADPAEFWVKRMSYGRLATMDPWDCGSSCWICHYEKREGGRRTRAERQWRKDWDL